MFYFEKLFKLEIFCCNEVGGGGGKVRVGELSN